MRCKFVISLALISGLLAITRTAAASQLQLVSQKKIALSFTSTQAIGIDANYIYLASYEGKLFILSRNLSGFPLVVKRQVSLQPLPSVRVDQAGHVVYVTSGDGELYKFSSLKPFTALGAVAYSPYGLRSLYVDQTTSTNPGSVFISEDSPVMTANGTYVYVSSLNDGQYAFRIDKSTGAITARYVESLFDPTRTFQFYRSGAEKGSIENPIDVLGRVSTPSLYVNNGILAIATPGCCGQGVFLYNAGTLKQYGTSTGIELYVDTVSIVANATRKLLTVGTEAGTVSVYDITNPANVVPRMTPVATIDLRAVTGHTGPEDIEIRSLATRLDAYGHLWIYAASSWGNSSMTSAYRSQLPSFFVLELK